MDFTVDTSAATPEQQAFWRLLEPLPAFNPALAVEQIVAQTSWADGFAVLGETLRVWNELRRFSRHEHEIGLPSEGWEAVPPDVVRAMQQSTDLRLSAGHLSSYVKSIQPYLVLALWQQPYLELMPAFYSASSTIGDISKFPMLDLAWELFGNPVLPFQVLAYEGPERQLQMATMQLLWADARVDMSLAPITFPMYETTNQGRVSDRDLGPGQRVAMLGLVSKFHQQRFGQPIDDDLRDQFRSRAFGDKVLLYMAHLVEHEMVSLIDLVLIGRQVEALQAQAAQAKGFEPEYNQLLERLARTLDVAS